MVNSFTTDSYTSTSFTTAAVAPSGGVTISGTHATPLIVTGVFDKLPEQLISVEFVFWLTATTIQKVQEKFKLLSTLLKNSISKRRLKSTILTESRTSFKVKSPMLVLRESIFKINSAIITAPNKSPTYIFNAGIKNKKARELLLRKLSEIIEDE